MKNLSKNNIFQTPEGYFENLPNGIVERYKRKKTRTVSFIRMTAAAAVVTIGVFIFAIKNETTINQTLEADLEDEIELYINSGYWQAEDILSFSDNPDLILDEIIEEEWGSVENGPSEDDLEEWR